MKRLLRYLNPIARFGETRYSIYLPFFTTLITAILLEIFAFIVVKDPEAVGLPAIFVFITLIIYFAFRDGLQGGAVTLLITISYYLYIIYSRDYQNQRLRSSLEVTAILGIVYAFLAGTIGWLKETIDKFIEREANEKIRLQTIIQQLPVGVILTDENGRVTETNKQINQILGTKIPIGFRLGKDSFGFDVRLNNKLISASQSPLSRALASGKMVDKEFEVLNNNKHLNLRVNASSILNRTGIIIAGASIISDITPQKELEVKKNDFINMASHEFKTPLTSIKLYLDMLDIQLKKGDKKASKTLRGLRDQTEKLQKIVNDLLDVSRLQTGKFRFEKEEFRLDLLVNEAVDNLQSLGKHKINFSKSAKLVVLADKFRIYQVVTNLITNAIKYSPASSVINVKVSKFNNKALVSVEDFGIGIEKSEQQKIFDKLYQISDDTRQNFAGFGMGLYISKEIIKRHKGQIWVESVKDKGSTFFFTLPLT